MKISAGFERLFFFVMSFLLICHIVSCMWVLTTTLYEDKSQTWVSEYVDYTTPNLYLTSIYFTITTITTVGYGDISISTPLEKIFCIIVMLIGVIAFSIASGSLASIL